MLYSARHASYWDSLAAAVHCFLWAIQARKRLLFVVCLLCCYILCMVISVVAIPQYTPAGSREAEVECDGCHVLLGDSTQTEGALKRYIYA